MRCMFVFQKRTRSESDNSKSICRGTCSPGVACVVVCCSVMQSAAKCCGVLQCALQCVCFSKNKVLNGTMPSPFVMVPDDRVLQLLQCVAVCCSVLQCVAECCNVCCSMFQKRTSSERDHTEAIRCGTLSNVLQRVAVFCMALQACCRELMCCSVLQCVAVCCSVCYREPVVCCGV